MLTDPTHSAADTSVSRSQTLHSQKDDGMGGQNDSKEQHGGDDSQKRQDHGDSGGSTGHGAASEMERMISQGREHRHHSGQADDAARGHGS